MTIDMGEKGQRMTRFVLQTSMDGKNWTTRARYPGESAAVGMAGRMFPRSRPSEREGIAVSKPEGRELPADWQEIMELTSNRASIKYLAAHVKSLSAKDLPIVETGHPGYSALIRIAPCSINLPPPSGASS